MEDARKSSRQDALQEMITRAQQMPGITELITVYGQYEDTVLKSQAYLDAHKQKSYSTLSNRSA